MPCHDDFGELSLHPAPAITYYGQLLYPQMTNEVDQSSVQQVALSQQQQRPILALFLTSWLFLYPWKLCSFWSSDIILWIADVIRCISTSTQQDKPHLINYLAVVAHRLPLLFSSWLYFLIHLIMKANSLAEGGFPGTKPIVLWLNINRDQCYPVTSLRRNLVLGCKMTCVSCLLSMDMHSRPSQ